MADAGAVAHRRIPGEGGIWVLIGGELFAFSTFFLIFSYYRGLDPELFRQSQLALSRGIGLFNTLVLLTSSLFVAMATRRVRSGDEGAPALFRLGMACGGVFMLFKAVEYGLKFRDGITPLTNDFFMYYYAFTGIHLGHVVIGVGVLAIAASAAARQPPSERRTMIVECCATFWHLVDLLWIVLFALFYLAGSHGQG